MSLSYVNKLELATKPVHRQAFMSKYIKMAIGLMGEADSKISALEKENTRLKSTLNSLITMSKANI